LRCAARQSIECNRRQNLTRLHPRCAPGEARGKRRNLWRPLILMT
jgi:hypothetical protein